MALTWVGLILFSASVLQGAAGFGFSLFATPLLVWGGMPLGDTVAVVSISIFVQVTAGTCQLRSEVPWRALLNATLVRYTTIPLGVALLVTVDSMGRMQIKQILGGILIAVLLLQLLWKAEARERVHSGWLVAAFAASGFLQGLVAMGGPPAVLWAIAQKWSARRTRAFLLALFLMTAPLQLPLLYFMSQHDLSGAFLTGAAFAPLAILGGIAGVRLGNLVHKPLLRNAALGILFATGILSILSPIL